MIKYPQFYTMPQPLSIITWHYSHKQLKMSHWERNIWYGDYGAIETMRKLDEIYKKTCFQILDYMQCQTVIPEIREINDGIQTIVPVFCLQEISGQGFRNEKSQQRHIILLIQNQDISEAVEIEICMANIKENRATQREK